MSTPKPETKSCEDSRTETLFEALSVSLRARFPKVQAPRLTGDALERKYRDLFGWLVLYEGPDGLTDYVEPKTAEELVALVCPHCVHNAEKCETVGIDRENECSRFEWNGKTVPG